LPWRVVPRQAQKATRLGGGLKDGAEAARARDEIEEVAVFARRRVGLMCNCT
jgi:hypothetical protein